MRDGGKVHLLISLNEKENFSSVSQLKLGSNQTKNRTLFKGTLDFIVKSKLLKEFDMSSLYFYLFK